MTETSVRTTVRREDVKRIIPGNVQVEIPYVPVPEESTERRYISIKLPNRKGLDSVTLPSYRNQIAVRRQLSA
jgi:hypothetical protein